MIQPITSRAHFVVALIPAYQPEWGLIELVRSLAVTHLPAIVVVDDGSGAEYAPIFRALRCISKVTVLRHAINMGKGAALKTGINFILCDHPAAGGVITLDADGQHRTEDVLRVCARFQQSPGCLVMGRRDFQGDVPLRSRFGNQLTGSVLRVVLGGKISDTQTGLRAIPRALLPCLLTIDARGYEFELEMLMTAKYMATKVIEEPIRTIYEPGNPTSHFQPLRDSMKIYFVLLRFSLIAILTAALDNAFFFLIFIGSGSILRAQLCARLAAVLVNYTLLRKAAFHSGEPHSVVLPRYLLVVGVNVALSYLGIRFLIGALPLHVLPAKILAESLLFVVNFLLQRDFVFTRRRAGAATDWDRYYHSVPPTARLTRRYTQSILIAALKRFAGLGRPIDSIVEIGGANSCFLDAIQLAVHPSEYHVVDQNQFGLSLLDSRPHGGANVILHKGDVLQLPEMGVKADVVFSVGLIEHFDPAGTRQAIAAHFDLLRKGGCAIISFPNLTWLYSASRAVCEMCGLWRFPDERAMNREEVARTMQSFGEIVFEKTLWPLVLTQHLMVIRKT